MNPLVAEVAGPATGRRERKKLQTRAALRAAALQLMSERGYDHVTVEDIADAADVSKRTFFNYFATKDEAVLAGDPDAPERVRQALSARPTGEPPLQALEAVLCALTLEQAGGREEWLARRALIRSEPRLLAASFAAWGDLERSLVAAIAERTGLDPETDLYPALVVSAAVGATRAASMRARAGTEVPLGQLLADAFSALRAGLPAPGQPMASRR